MSKPITRSRSSQHLRSKFFSKIGILNHTQSQSISVNERSVRDLRCMPKIQLPLQYDQEEEMIPEQQRARQEPHSLPISVNLPKSAASSRTNTKKNQDSSVEKKQDKSVEKKKQDKSVKFNDKVIAIPIPTRHEYSRRIRSKLWTDSVEMCENTGK